MSTTQTPAVQTPAVQTSAATSRTRTVVLATAALLAGAGITAGVVLGLGSTAPAASVPAAVPSSSAQVVVPSGSGTHHHVTPVTPVHPVAPSAAIETLQRELGQLNYYEGPVTGTMTSQTTQAITYLQRDAHLPQTGTMNAATQAALANFLANGNNQMGN
jgi:peptidoglycan hydrolase-like protein with peptidoglycan-binding domain